MSKFRPIIKYLSQLAGFLLVCSILGLSSPVKAQPVLSAQNTAMGGGGTTYLSGFETTFWNPANLAINDRPGQVNIGLGHTGILFEPVLSADNPYDQFFKFTDGLMPYKSYTTSISSAQRDRILEKNYPKNTPLSWHQNRADVILGGVSWQRGEAAYSVTARYRFASRFEVGRGWYSDEFIPDGDQQVRDFTLNQQRNQLLEFSVGYGRQFTFIDGLLPRLSELYIGIAPKIVLAGPHFNASYDARYIRSEEGDASIYASDFSYQTTGKYSGMTSRYLVDSNPWSAIERNLNSTFDPLDNTGYGLGFDFGLTYLIPLDLSLIDDDPESLVSHSIRFSLSANDIGMIRYHEDPLQLSSAADTVAIEQELPKESMFIGSGGQYLMYFDELGAISNPIQASQSNNSDQFSTLLPASVNAGMLIDLSRIKVSGDLNLGLDNTAFTTTKLSIHLGLEGRPLKPVPIRFGARIASERPTYIGLGTGIETRYLDFNIGTQLVVRSRTFTSEFAGGAFAGIQLHL